MADTITMSNKEANRVTILERVKTKTMTQKQAAIVLGVTERQVRRLIKRYRQEGVKGLIHKGRGKPSNRRVSGNEVEAAVEFLSNPLCHDFGPTFAHEQLTKNHLITFGVDTLRQVMVQHGKWIPKKRRRLHPHQFRERMGHFGDMLQLDGSPHDWLEGRVDPATGAVVGECTLHAAIDDATGRFKGWFEKEETTMGYFRLMKRYLLETGKPGQTYSDRHRIFTLTERERESTCLHTPGRDRVGEAETQFERAMRQLSIGMILARSPQAKGRVEKLNATLQDRLIKEMRLRHICTLEAANQFLPTFEAEYNANFGVTPRSAVNTHRPLTAEETDHLTTILAYQVTRTLSKNLTCQWEHVIYQIKPKQAGYALRQAKVQLCRTLTNQVVITYHQQSLAYTTHTVSPKQWRPDTKQLASLARHTTNSFQTFWEAYAETGWNQYDRDYQVA